MKAALLVHLVGAVVWIGGMFFAYVFFSPFPALKRAGAAQDWKAGAAALNGIRGAVAVNLALGLANLAIATVGRV